MWTASKPTFLSLSPRPDFFRRARWLTLPIRHCGVAYFLNLPESVYVAKLLFDRDYY